MADRQTIPKQHLGIEKFDMDIPYAQGTKFLDRVHAINLSLPEDSPLAGKPLRFSVFNGELKTYIRGKSEIVADIEEKPRPDNPEYGPDRTIVQVYDEDGNPISRKNRGGGGGNYRRSLEEDLALEAVKRRSIEAQASMNQVGRLLTSPTEVTLEEMCLTPEDWTRILGKYWKLVEQGFDNYVEKPPQEKPPITSDKPQGQRQRSSSAKSVSKDGPPSKDPIKHIGDLFTRASKLDPAVTPAEVQTAMGLNPGEPIDESKFEEAWERAQGISEAKKNQAAVQEAEQLPFS